MPLASICFVIALQTSSKPAVSPGQTIVEFCESSVGKQVGIGECSSLAEAALKAVGAQPRRKTDWPMLGDYVWGDLAYKIDFVAAPDLSGNRQMSEGPTREARLKVVPGDIIQFRDVHFVHIDGGSRTWITMPHHTAIVGAVSPDGRTWGIYEQNWSGHRYVRKTSISTSDLTSGAVMVYHPTMPGPKDEGSKIGD
jgi:hypothetical protein